MNQGLTRGLLAPGLAIGMFAGALAVIPGAATAGDSVIVVSGAHQGKRCHTKGKVVTVGHNKWDKVKLKCTVVRRGDRKVKVWKFHGRA